MDFIRANPLTDYKKLFFSQIKGFDNQIIYFKYIMSTAVWPNNNPAWSNYTPAWLNVPHAWGLAGLNGYMYVSNYDAGTISQIDVSNGSIVNSNWASDILNTPEDFVINAAGTYMYVLDSSNNSISQVDMSGGTVNNDNWTTASLDSPYGIVIDPLDEFMYVANYGNNTISKIDASNGQVVDSSWVSLLDRPIGLVLNATGTYMYVATENNNKIAKINVETRSVDDEWATGLTDPVYLTIDSAGKYMYVSDYVDNAISQIDMSDPLLVTEFITGLDYPAQLKIIDDYLYVVNYNTGNIGKYLLPPPGPGSLICFKKDSKILTNKGYRLIQDLKKGDLVKTLKNGFKPIDTIATRKVDHRALPERIKDQLYECSPSEYPDLFEPLVITGRHSILVNKLTSLEQRAKVIEVNGDVFLTDQKYRLPACADFRASVYDIPGTYDIYHFALESDNNYINYGVFANGLLVESCSKKALKELFKMTCNK